MPIRSAYNKLEHFRFDLSPPNKLGQWLERHIQIDSQMVASMISHEGFPLINKVPPDLSQDLSVQSITLQAGDTIECQDKAVFVYSGTIRDQFDNSLPLKRWTNIKTLCRPAQDSFALTASTHVELRTISHTEFIQWLQTRPRVFHTVLTNVAACNLQFCDPSSDGNVIVYSAREHDRKFMDPQFTFTEARLDWCSAMLATGHRVAVLFVNDDASSHVLRQLHQVGIRCLLLRCAGHDNVDLRACRELGIRVANVPAYSPESIAEHTIALLLSLVRSMPRTSRRAHWHDSTLPPAHHMPFELAGTTVGIIGYGQIGRRVAQILASFACTVLVYDIIPPRTLMEQIEAKVRFVSLPELLRKSQIVTLHVPPNKQTEHLINACTISMMPDHCILINTSCGSLIDTKALLAALEGGKLWGVALNVPEGEWKYFYQNYQTKIIHDDLSARLLTFPNVLVTSHQAFYTEEALQSINHTVTSNLQEFIRTGNVINSLL